MSNENVRTIEFTRDGLEAAGFKGFHHLYERREERFAEVPEGPGVYAVLRESERPVEFVDPDGNGALAERWVPDAQVVYIGRADTLRRRLSRLAVKGAGRAVADWSGRVIWQIGDTESMTVAWLGTLPDDSGKLRARLLDSFSAQHGGRPPFGNQRKSG